MVDHSYSEAYMPSRNGRAECAFGLVKRMIQLNTPNGNSQLQDLVQAINVRASGVPRAGYAYERLLGRKPLLDIPCLLSDLCPEQKEDMAKQMSVYRERSNQEYTHGTIQARGASLGL